MEYLKIRDSEGERERERERERESLFKAIYKVGVVPLPVSLSLTRSQGIVVVGA